MPRTERVHQSDIVCPAGGQLALDLSGRTMHRAGFRRHLRAMAARHAGIGLTGLGLGRAGNAGTTLGAQVSTIEGSARRREGRDILGGFAVVDLGIGLGGTGEEKTKGENGGES
jgi:hypothetical protein